MADTALNIFGLNCSLKRSDAKGASSTEVLMTQFFDALGAHGASGDIVRAADHDIKPGVTSDEGAGDAWPALRKRVIACDILVIGSPIWLGQPSSIAKRALERMDAFLGEKDARGRMPSYGKVAVSVIVGNEDGAHHCHAACFQALNDVGWTIPAGSTDYWVGEAMQKKDFKDLAEVPEPIARGAAMLAANAAHLATVLKDAPYPGIPEAK